MHKVIHKVKGREYQYSSHEEAQLHAEQAVEQSDGVLLMREAKDGDFEIYAAKKGKQSAASEE